MLTRSLDWLERRAKPLLKTCYQRPVIELARAWRRVLWRTGFIGITGSAGKTTTKDLLHAALGTRYRCTKNTESNNQIYGVARSLLRSRPSTAFCVQEVGASEPGRFDAMMGLLQPRVGVVTTVGTDHLTSFGNAEGVAAEKVKLIECLPREGIAVLNADDPLVAAMAQRCRAQVVTYGLQAQAEFRGSIITDRWPDRLSLRVSHRGDSVLVPTRFLARYQAGNVLAAIATACSLGVPLPIAAEAVGRYEPPLARMSVHLTQRGVSFIRDDIKAPLWSISMALQYMAEAQAERKIIVIGTISDAGNRVRGIYRQPVTEALAGADHVLLVGPRAVAAATRLKGLGGERLTTVGSVQEAAEWLRAFTRAGDLVLLKGSKHADHLARLALAIDHNVGCWRSSCPRGIFCDHCRLLMTPAAP